MEPSFSICAARDAKQTNGQRRRILKAFKRRRGFESDSNDSKAVESVAGITPNK